MVNTEEIETTEEEFEEELNEIYGTVNVCGFEMDAGTVLKECDPVAFRCGLADKETQYKCGECGSVFDTEEKAEECCEDEDVENGN